MNDPVSIGPFDLGPRLGEGGMGAVYRGEHRSTGVPVAIKVLRHETDPDARDRFHREVQAHAGLQHPGVVYLFDYGDINPEAADASGDELRAGDPFVAMELAERGTVREAGSVDTWESVCRLLVQVLDALAYAHARGVVHRDLKPENLLLFGPEDPGGPEWRVKLADFGIAHALQQEREADTAQLEGAVGTPMYMAPEQCRGEWREYGPWTDLYAVGCIAWELVCGRPPFRGDNIVSIVRSHEQEARPPLDPQFPVPEQLESWIHRAMAVDPERRFRRGADAAWALPRGVLAAASEHTESREGSATNREGVGAANRDDDRRAPTAAETRVETLASTVILNDDPSETAFAETVAARESDGSDRETNEPEPERIMAHGHPPVPEDWRPAHTEPLPAPLVGAGLGLFGLREPPFVNRTQECRRIWEALREVVEDQTPRLISVRGEAGTGKSRLVEWMATRAHEVGAMQTLRAIHTQAGGPGEGLRGALEETLRTLKMDRGEVFEHLRETLPPLEGEGNEWRRRDARALTEYLRPTDDQADEVDGPRYRFSSADQKHGLLVRILRRLSRRRPLLVWLDDLQWGDEARAVLEELIDGDDSPAVLAVATLRSDILRERRELADELESLEAAESATRLSLEPLEADHQQKLLQGLLPLDDALAGRLAERTEGHPLFAMQLLAHWIEEGVLETDPEGFRVPSDRQVELPADIHELWMDRIDRLVDRFPPDARRPTLEALERAAALGREIDGDEWREVCRAFDRVDPEPVRHRLVEAGLAERTDRGWAFAHGMLVDSLEQRADEQGRRRRHHRRCAELLERVYPDRPKETAARRAEHRIEAGDLEEALEPLFQKADRLREWGKLEESRRVLERRGELLEMLEVPADAPLAVDHDLKVANADFVLGTAPDRLRERLEALRERAERAGSLDLLARAWRDTSSCRRSLGQGKAAAEAAREAVRLAEASGDAGLLAETLLQRGWTAALHLRDFDAVREKFSAAHSHAIEVGHQLSALEARRGLAWVAMSRGLQERASVLFEKTLREAREAGYRTVEVRCLSGLGEMARFDGETEEARERYCQVRELKREMNNRQGVAISTANLAQVELMAGHFERAAKHLTDAERQLEELSRRTRRTNLLRLSHLTRAAGVADWSAFDELFAHYADGWPEETQLIKDHPWLLEMAGDYAAEAGEAERARRVWRLAGELWRELDDEAAASEVEEKLEELGDETPRG